MPGAACGLTIYHRSPKSTSMTLPAFGVRLVRTRAAGRTRGKPRSHPASWPRVRVCASSSSSRFAWLGLSLEQVLGGGFRFRRFAQRVDRFNFIWLHGDASGVDAQQRHARASATSNPAACALPRAARWSMTEVMLRNRSVWIAVDRAVAGLRCGRAGALRCAVPGRPRPTSPSPIKTAGRIRSRRTADTRSRYSSATRTVPTNVRRRSPRSRARNARPDRPAQRSTSCW